MILGSWLSDRSGSLAKSTTGRRSGGSRFLMLAIGMQDPNLAQLP